MGTLGDRDLVGRKYGRFWFYYSRAPFSFGAFPRYRRSSSSGDRAVTWGRHEIGVFIVPESI